MKSFRKKLESIIIGLSLLAVAWHILDVAWITWTDIDLGEKVFRILFGSISLFLSIGFLFPQLLEKLFSLLPTKKKKCLICSQPAHDTLTAKHEIGTFCRQHLIAKYSELFLMSSPNIVIVEFQPKATEFTGVVYGYYPLSELANFGWGKKDKDVIQTLVMKVKSEKCRICEKQSNALFLPKEVAPWKKYGASPNSDFISVGEFLCKEHALKRILPSLQTNPKYFDDGGGLYVPCKEDGFQVTTEL